MKLLQTLTLAALSGCYLSRYPVTPNVADSGTYKLLAGPYSGTAWAADEWHLVSAGHMCDLAGRIPHFVVEGRGRSFTAEAVLWELSETNGRADACVLKSSMPLAHPLIIADRMPEIGEDVGYVGYPLGDWRSARGKFLGDLDGPDEHDNDAVASAPADHGASGSAMYSSRGVWGVLVRIRTDGGLMHEGDDGEATISLDALRALMDAAGVKYDVTPRNVGYDIP